MTIARPLRRSAAATKAEAATFHGRRAILASNRRMGLETSTTRGLLMDGVEIVMTEQGYAALSARSVAEAVGLKHQLVFYYFANMEDLLLSAYRRRTGQVLDRVTAALASEQPLHALWDTQSEPTQAALTVEYMALANHNTAIRAETIAFGERIRREGLAHIGETLRLGGALQAQREVLNPFALTMAISCIGAILGMETALGISGGHRETRELVRWCLDRLQTPASG